VKGIGALVLSLSFSLAFVLPAPMQRYAFTVLCVILFAGAVLRRSVAFIVTSVIFAGLGHVLYWTELSGSLMGMLLQLRALLPMAGAAWLFFLLSSARDRLAIVAI